MTVIRSGPLEPSPEQRLRWTQQVTAHAEHFLRSLPAGPAFRSTEEEGRGILSAPLAEEPEALESALKSFAENVQKPGVKL